MAVFQARKVLEPNTFLEKMAVFQARKVLEPNTFIEKVLGLILAQSHLCLTQLVNKGQTNKDKSILF